MHARDLATPYPTVRETTGALDAARVLTEHNRPGLIVVDEHEHPVAILPASQVLRMVIPQYVQDDPALARVLDEEFADRLTEQLAGRTVADLLPDDHKPLPVVAPDDSVLEIAAVMAATHSPLVAVVEEPSDTATMSGAISAAQLLGRVLAGG